MNKQVQDQVKITLEESELWGCTRCSGDTSEGVCNYCAGNYHVFPSAKEAEAVLEKMDMLVAWNNSIHRYELLYFMQDLDGFADTSVAKKITRFEPISKGECELVKYAALAWCCENMRPELEKAIKELEN